MKVALCLLAVLAVALARPQLEEKTGPLFLDETIAIARQQNLIRPEVRLFGLREAPLYNYKENVPYQQPVSVAEIVVPFQERAVYPPLQRSVDDSLARF